ncbi:DUF4810 domain-containing protein [Chromobacterium sp. IIBBL 290-4]|uniref:DUF4810 domain-containing protein n=1 Tax=Chromobacterium sp. IIBBL 290-4 TaxID=2953890 RepID=UPI0020B74E3B|nr:DUF4810 domain-containing protein [Chromobacterium sp. IIBBL 290-4]UTH75105.1 DUF4810 domain-containing protein [Chromobacterium sp. IIBBL 290-4]
MKTKKTLSSAAAAFACAALLSACAGGPPTLYQWEGYQPHVYAYLKGEAQDPQKQIAEMEEGLHKIRSSGRHEPPGYHAHMGLLYASAGQLDKMNDEFQTEKKLFPESSAYIDFLLAKQKQS